MTLAIAGRGWVTPLGSGIEPVWSRLMAGEQAVAESIGSEISDRTFPVYRVPPEAAAALPPHPRLRRSSAISRFAAAAGFAALADAGVEMTPAIAERTAIVFAISNGGVVYTKRFYHDVVATGAQAASPLLFPETVFNAPASHLAAILGVAGASYTLVGDGAVSVLAMQMAADLLNDPALDRCLVVGAEEADWLLCDAYRKWRLLRPAPPIEPFATPPRGMVLSEGAGAVLLARSGAVRIDSISPGTNFARQSEAPAAVDSVMAGLCRGSEFIVCSANGTFIDNAERAAAAKRAPTAPLYTPKPALGESVGAGGMWQIICADQALRSGILPPNDSPQKGLTTAGLDAVVSVCGLNQQVGGLRLARSAT